MPDREPGVGVVQIALDTLNMAPAFIGCAGRIRHMHLGRRGNRVLRLALGTWLLALLAGLVLLVVVLLVVVLVTQGVQRAGT